MLRHAVLLAPLRRRSPFLSLVSSPHASSSSFLKKRTLPISTPFHRFTQLPISFVPLQSFSDSGQKEKKEKKEEEEEDFYFTGRSWDDGGVVPDLMTGTKQSNSRRRIVVDDSIPLPYHMLYNSWYRVAWLRWLLKGFLLTVGFLAVSYYADPRGGSLSKAVSKRMSKAAAKEGANKEAMEAIEMMKQYVLSWLYLHPEVMTDHLGPGAKIDEGSFEVTYDYQTNTGNFAFNIMAVGNKWIKVSGLVARRRREEIVYPIDRHVWFLYHLRFVYSDQSVLDVKAPDNVRVVVPANHQYIIEDIDKVTLSAANIFNIAETEQQELDNPKSKSKSKSKSRSKSSRSRSKKQDGDDDDDDYDD